MVQVLKVGSVQCSQYEVDEVLPKNWFHVCVNVLQVLYEYFKSTSAARRTSHHNHHAVGQTQTKALLFCCFICNYFQFISWYQQISLDGIHFLLVVSFNSLQNKLNDSECVCKQLFITLLLIVLCFNTVIVFFSMLLLSCVSYFYWFLF